MFRNRSTYFDNTLKLVQLGYEEFSPELIENVIIALSQNNLNDSHRDYLKICLKNLLNSKNAQKSFYLKNDKGRKKKAVALRDLFCAYQMIVLEQYSLTYEERLAQTVELTNKKFEQFLIDRKTVERAYTKYKAKVLRDLANGQSYLSIFISSS